MTARLAMSMSWLSEPRTLSPSTGTCLPGHPPLLPVNKSITNALSLSPAGENDRRLREADHYYRTPADHWTLVAAVSLLVPCREIDNLLASRHGRLNSLFQVALHLLS